MAYAGVKIKFKDRDNKTYIRAVRRDGVGAPPYIRVNNERMPVVVYSDRSVMVHETNMAPGTLWYDKTSSTLRADVYENFSIFD
jgi:hypothetical protein